MKRAILAFLAALVTWLLIVSVLDRGLRIALAGYAVAEPKMTFTVGMMIARLTIAAMTSVIAGAVAGWISPMGVRVAGVMGATLLVLFIPEHVRLWNSFPIWYHLTFLVTLVPLLVLGSWLTRTRPSGRSPVDGRSGQPANLSS
jgi:protein-S-isoprenylcysteine O-methyltransferase Ste14